MRKKKPSVDKLALDRAGAVIDEIERLSEARKKLYLEHDELAKKLEAVPAELLLAHRLELERPFAKGNTQWGHGPVRELVLRRPEAPKKPRAKA